SGTVECWGDDVFGGLLGRGDVGEDWSPTAVPGITGAVDVVIDLGYACALLRDGRVACWGGAGEAPPSVVNDVADAVEVAVGRYFACARLAWGGVSCWGYPNAALGRGDA